LDHKSEENEKWTLFENEWNGTHDERAMGKNSQGRVSKGDLLDTGVGNVEERPDRHPRTALVRLAIGS
jgi:hypothetical protein